MLSICFADCEPQFERGEMNGEEDEGAAAQESDGVCGPPEGEDPNVRRDFSLRRAGRELDLASAIRLAADSGAI
jgi:hypothetical protein